MSLPSQWHTLYADNTAWQWTAFALMLAITTALPKLISKLIRRSNRRVSVIAAAMFVTSWFGSDFLLDEINLTGTPEFIGIVIFGSILYIALALLVFLACEWIGKMIMLNSKISPYTANASLIKLLSHVCGTGGFLAVIAIGASSAGLPVLGVITGLGVSSMGIALAAKSTAENLLASIVLFLDGAIKVGDDIETIEAHCVSGVVEEIGMRSTRIRAPDGTLINITNSGLAEKTVKNSSQTREPREVYVA
ncbi:mechanosensitive ion channel domain-containing protein [Agrobacterium vitis]|uniref:mechanosensitive ion channel domain-containing protein n=1 Tax=Agrobacterium vitis TaxID=373 RepID=UPI003D29B639